MKGIVLVVDGAQGSREHLASALAGEGASTIVAASARDALRQLGSTGTRPSVIVLDPRSVPDAAVVLEASHGNPLVAHVPIVLVGVIPAEHPALPPHVHVTAWRGHDHELLATLAGLMNGPPALPDARFARGTGQVASAPTDVHAYAESKLIQFLGDRGGRATLAAVLAQLGLERLATTADLHAVANILRGRGAVETAVAVLLSGRATLIDSDRTLRTS